MMSFKTTQAAMAAYLRAPEEQEAPQGIEDRRLGIYRDLIFNNIEGFLSGSFPVLRELYEEADWLHLVREFVKSHQSHSPYFLHISQEFIQFLQEEYQPKETDPAFMLELAHYEWVELALDVAVEEIPDTALLPQEVSKFSNVELLARRLNLSPLAWPLSYQFPVHQIRSDFRPEQADEQAHFIVAYRQDEEVKFLASNGATVRLLVLLSQQAGSTAEELLRELAAELQHPDWEQFLQFGCELLADLLQKQIVYISAK